MLHCFRDKTSVNFLGVLSDGCPCKDEDSLGKRFIEKIELLTFEEPSKMIDWKGILLIDGNFCIKGI